MFYFIVFQRFFINWAHYFQKSKYQKYHSHFNFKSKNEFFKCILQVDKHNFVVTKGLSEAKEIVFYYNIIIEEAGLKKYVKGKLEFLRLLEGHTLKWQMWDVGDRFFDDDTNISILPSTSWNCHHYKVGNTSSAIFDNSIFNSCAVKTHDNVNRISNTFLICR